MASLARFGRLARPLFMSRGALAPAGVRFAGYWNKDWKPGPYPKTPEERYAAAKKYGMRPEDYVPIPDDGFGAGDYPALPHTPGVERDEFHDWDDESLKRDYGEVLHVDFDATMETRINPIEYKWYHRPNDVRGICIMTFGWILMFTGYYFKVWKVKDNGVAPKEYFLEDGKPHYTFDAKDS